MGCCVLRSAAELFLEHVHEQPVVPDAVGAALVPTHDPHLAEAHPFVSADRCRVVGRRVDREAMVAAPLEEIAGEHPNRFCAQALPMAGCTEIDVHASVAIHRVVLLVALDRSYDLPPYLDDEGVVSPYELLAYLLLDVIAAPPPGNFGFGSDLKEPVDVIGAARTQQHALSSQYDHVDPTLLSSARATLR